MQRARYHPGIGACHFMGLFTTLLPTLRPMVWTVEQSGKGRGEGAGLELSDVYACTVLYVQFGKLS